MSISWNLYRNVLKEKDRSDYWNVLELCSFSNSSDGFKVQILYIERPFLLNCHIYFKNLSEIQLARKYILNWTIMYTGQIFSKKGFDNLSSTFNSQFIQFGSQAEIKWLTISYNNFVSSQCNHISKRSKCKA